MAAVLAVLAVSAGLTQTHPGATPGSPKSHTRAASGRPANLKTSDADVERDIRARLARSKIHTDGFQVRVQGGVATLDGKTDVVQHKGTATRLAKAAGAAQVVNRIQVSQAARDRAAKSLNSGRRRAQVKRGEERDERK